MSDENIEGLDFGVLLLVIALFGLGFALGSHGSFQSEMVEFEKEVFVEKRILVNYDDCLQYVGVADVK